MTSTTRFAVLSATPTRAGRRPTVPRLWTALLYDLRLGELLAAGIDGRGVQIGVLHDREFTAEVQAAVKVLETIAPKAYVDVREVGHDAHSIRTAVGARRDLWLVPWGRGDNAAYAAAFLPVRDRLVTVKDPAGEVWAPAVVPGATPVGIGSVWPMGPYVLGDKPWRVASGPAVGAAVVAGLAALLVQRGEAPIRAVRRVASAREADIQSLLPPS